jgi:hypothetical protein
VHRHDALRIHVFERARFGCESDAPDAIDLLDVLIAQLTDFRNPRTSVGADPGHPPLMRFLLCT